MNWVWGSSPTSGNERLVLLALADACSRDDGTGCWPSAATIARKANISDRTVRRVIARLEAEGHVLVHRGGGRAGSTNSYTVVTAIHSPGQTVTPDNLSGGDTGDTPPRTQPCQGTPDTAVSPDPPGNHQRTTPARPRGKSASAAGWRPAGGRDWRVLRRSGRAQLAVGADGGPAPEARPCCRRGACGRLDPGRAGRARRGQHRRDQEPGRRTRRPALPGRAAAFRANPAGRAAAVVRPMRRAHANARLRRRRTAALPALQDAT